jgi:hypothetical protein
MTLTHSTAPRGTSRLVYRAQGAKTLVYNPVTDQLHLLSKLGADILRRCDGTRSAAQLAGDLFPVGSPGAARAEWLVRGYLDELRRRQLVDADTSPDPDARESAEPGPGTATVPDGPGRPSPAGTRSTEHGGAP